MKQHYPPPPAFFGRPSPEIMAARSPEFLDNFIERQIKAERKTYWFPYIYAIFLFGIGAHRFYLRQYIWGFALLALYIGALGLSAFSLLPAGASKVLIAVWVFEVASLWWFVARFNRLNEKNIRREYAVSKF